MRQKTVGFKMLSVRLTEPHKKSGNPDSKTRRTKPREKQSSKRTEIMQTILPKMNTSTVMYTRIINGKENLQRMTFKPKINYVLTFLYNE